MSSHLNNVENFGALRLSDARGEYLRQIADTASDSLGFIDRVDLILSAEMSMRYNRRVARRIKDAGLRVVAYKEEFSFESDRGITKSAFANLTSLSWAGAHHSVLISGATGVGKTYLACMLATEAARREMTVRYHRTSDLIEKLALARADGSHRQAINGYRKVDLLVLDDFGLSPIPISASRELLEILDARVDAAPTVIASQFPPETFHQLIEDATAADAILDRIVHDAIVIKLTGESMRRLKLRTNRNDRT